MRVHHLWIRLIGIIWGLWLGPVAAADAPATAVPVCQRTPRVRDALVRATCPQCSCMDITSERLATLRELNLRQLGLARLKAGDFSGLKALETLDLTGNPLKNLPPGLATELGALKHLKMDLTLFTRLPDAVVTPLIDRPGFSWDLDHHNRACGPFDPRPPKKQSLPGEDQLASVLQLPSADEQLFMQTWTQGIILVGLETEKHDLKLFALSQEPAQKWRVLAQTTQPLPLEDSPNYIFDLAPYRLSPRELGFGLRQVKSESVPYQRWAREEQLRIFRIHEGALQEVLRTIMYTQYDQSGPPAGIAEPEQANASDWSYQERTCAVLAVAQSRTRGVFNWVKVQSSVTTREKPEKSDSGISHPTVIFRWTGDRYETQQDPTSSVLFED